MTAPAAGRSTAGPSTAGPSTAELSAAGPAAGGEAGRWELLRALGAVATTLPPGADHLFEALGLPVMTRAEHTAVFALELPPHASVHLGAEGKLGGDGADRVAGVWRALGLTPPPDADHLGILLHLYAELGEAAAGCRTEGARRRLDHVRAAVLWEHLWPWVPAYLHAVRHQHPAAAPWAALGARALAREAARTPPARTLPLAMRQAPAPLGTADPSGDLVRILTVPLRTGFILTATDVAAAARATGTGLRRGERRFALQAMVDQDPVATLRWLARHAAAWARWHGRLPGTGTEPAPWWAARAAASAAVLGHLAEQAAC